jgi:hypothetical protein
VVNHRFGLFRFRSPLLTESLSISFPPLTEMFHFSGCGAFALCIHAKAKEGYSSGLPHSDIDGSKRICRSPSLNAAYHVLHRLLAPRHPSCALCSLTKPIRPIGLLAKTWSRKVVYWFCSSGECFIPKRDFISQLFEVVLLTLTLCVDVKEQ